MQSGVDVTEVVRMLKIASEARPGAYVGEMEPGPMMRVYDGPAKNEIGRIEFGSPSRIVWLDAAAS